MVSWLLDKIDINISVQDDIWSLEQYQSIISEAIYTVLDHLNLMDEFKSSSISIVLTNDNFIQSLNKQYRFIDKPTNVLSFPQERNLDFGEDCLGDIILSFERIKEEGDQQNKEFQSHLIHLVIHGLLHVLGYDHEINSERPLYNNSNNPFSSRSNYGFSSAFNTNPFLPRNNTEQRNNTGLFTNNTNNNNANHTSTNTEPRMTYSFNFLPSIMGNSLFTNVIVRPSTEQIEAATETLTYDENETFMNNQCPISLEDFRNGEQIRRIIHCGHCFSENSFTRWFNSNVRCPICRHDIRDNIPRTDISNNTTVNRSDSNLEETLLEALNRLETQEINNDLSQNNNVSNLTDASFNLALRVEIPLQYTASFDSSNNFISGNFV